MYKSSSRRIRTTRIRNSIHSAFRHAASHKNEVPAYNGVRTVVLNFDELNIIFINKLRIVCDRSVIKENELETAKICLKEGEKFRSVEKQKSNKCKLKNNGNELCLVRVFIIKILIQFY